MHVVSLKDYYAIMLHSYLRSVGFGKDASRVCVVVLMLFTTSAHSTVMHFMCLHVPSCVYCHHVVYWECENRLFASIFSRLIFMVTVASPSNLGAKLTLSFCIMSRFWSTLIGVRSIEDFGYIHLWYAWWEWLMKRRPKLNVSCIWSVSYHLWCVYCLVDAYTVCECTYVCVYVCT